MTTTSPASSANELVRHLERQLEDIRATITAEGRRPSDVRIVAVTKTFSWDHVVAARAVGLVDVGENYVSELIEKAGNDTARTMNWHYLGALQSNKIAKIAKIANVISGVSRGKEIEKLASQQAQCQIDIQVDTTGRDERNGAPPHLVEGLVTQARALGLTVRGLMVVAPPDHAGAEHAFSLVTSLADDLGLVERSMGMSDDFALACRLGSTEIRLGRRLFGAREPVAAKP